MELCHNNDIKYEGLDLYINTRSLIGALNGVSGPATALLVARNDAVAVTILYNMIPPFPFQLRTCTRVWSCWFRGLERC